jgi:hypothetical protein
MIIETRKARFGPWSFGPEKQGLDQGHFDQKSQVWTMAIRTRKAMFGPWIFRPEKPGLYHGRSD